jgi:ferrochelatase
MAYGSAQSLDEESVRAYLTHILQFYRHAVPTDDEVRNLRERYQAVGGSPLYDITARIITATQRALDLAAPGAFRVFMAMKHSSPTIEDRVRRIAKEGFSRAIGLPLVPFRSRLSTEGYYKLIREVNRELPKPIEWCFPGDWNLHPMFLALWHRRVVDARRSIDGEPYVVFTNHSLPGRIMEWGDPYPKQFEETASALAKRCGLHQWSIAYQSAGGGRGTWLGPALNDVLAELIGTGYRAIVLAPLGFVMDHLEVLYDLDRDAVQMGREHGVEVTRARMPNDDPLLVAMLADVVRGALQGTAVKPRKGKKVAAKRAQRTPERQKTPHG